MLPQLGTLDIEKMFERLFQPTGDRIIPPFASVLEHNLFEVFDIVRIWARAGTGKRPTYELVIQIDQKRFLRGSFMPLPGFYDAGTARPSMKPLSERAFIAF